jgi:HD-like signal output (HDOD) protein
MREQLLHSIEQDGLLPPFPGIIRQLRDMIEDSSTGMNEVAQVIQSDPVLTGRLIRLANSVFGAGTSFVANDLNRALGRLGLKMAMDLAYSLKIPSMFPEKAGFAYVDFWKYSLGLGVVASKLGEARGLSKDEISHAYLGGLMRNTGVLLFMHLQSKSYMELLSEGRSSIAGLDPVRTIRRAMQFEGTETKKFGINNAELGAAFIRRWWKVDPEVLAYVVCRPKIVQNKQQHLVEMARYVLWDAKVPDGILSPAVTMPPQLLEKFSIGEDLRQQLHSDLRVAFQIMR